MAKKLNEYEVSKALNESRFLDELEENTGLTFDRDSTAFHEIDAFIVSKLSLIRQ